MHPHADDRINPEDTAALAQFAMDLQDSEVAKVGQIVTKLSQKYSERAFTVENLDALRDEALTRFMEIGILASMDVAPCMNGEPPTVEIIGRVEGTEQAVHGLDHERKGHEVRKATDRGEEFLGQKETSGE